MPGHAAPEHLTGEKRPGVSKTLEKQWGNKPHCRRETPAANPAAGCWGTQGAGEALSGGGESGAGASTSGNRSSWEHPQGCVAVPQMLPGERVFALVCIHLVASASGCRGRGACGRGLFAQSSPRARPGSRPPPGHTQPRKASTAEWCCEKFSCYRFSTSKHAKKLRSAYPTFLPCYFSLGHHC